ncbi:helix-turn-helix domain-containing protein [Massilia sp. W12]|uniref:TetR/AcrR family transcriptional regulator n=1 Tax=Massilia sp. W12 TaxID=3126507 RepID=UPI0030D12246
MGIKELPVHFTLAQFCQATPLNQDNIWEFLLQRNAERIGVKRREAALENLERIFGATFRLANTVGFREMSLRDLCRETGLSMGGLYGYIQSKDQLASMIADMVLYATDLLQQWFLHVPDPLDHIECIVRANIYMAEILQPWLYFMFLESRALQQEQREVAKASESNIQTHIAGLAVQLPGFNQEQAWLFSAHCMSLAQDWHLKRWKFRNLNLTPDAFAESVVRLVRAHVQRQEKLAA